jgi:4a-hydroxytetrahydrobiopterin dehydratase
MSELLSKDELKRLLKRIPEWELEGKKITRTVEFDDFSDAVDFINDLAEIVEDAGHHPEIDIRQNKVILALTTHEAGGLTEQDIDVAERIDNLVD